jgi:phospholipid/cholesterol/gamma-HCH transport system permease protein
VDVTAVRAEHQALLDLICNLDLKPLPKPVSVPRWRQVIIDLGKGADDAWRDTLDVITFGGRAASAVGLALLHPRSLRFPSISRQVAETGVKALPIIGLMAVMISVVIGYQGVAQLRPYGGEPRQPGRGVGVARDGRPARRSWSPAAPARRSLRIGP